MREKMKITKNSEINSGIKYNRKGVPVHKIHHVAGELLRILYELHRLNSAGIAFLSFNDGFSSPVVANNDRHNALTQRILEVTRFVNDMKDINEKIFHFRRNEIRNALKLLKDKGMISYVVFLDNDMQNIEITAEGIEYVEKESFSRSGISQTNIKLLNNEGNGFGLLNIQNENNGIKTNSISSIIKKIFPFL